VNSKPHFGGAFLLLMYEKLIEQLVAAGRLDEGRKAIEELLRKEPENSSAWNILFLIHIEIGDKQSALKVINRFLTLENNSAVGWMNKGNVLHEIGMDREAIESYDKSISLNPQSSYVYSNKSNSLLKINQYEEALNSCDFAISLDSKNSEAWMNKANCYLKIGDLNQAEICIRKSLDINAYSSKAWLNFARILNAKNQDDEAIKYYQKSIELNPSFAQAYINLGYTFNRIGDNDRALYFYEKACDLDKNIIPAAKWNMALIHLSLGNWQKGWELYENRWFMDEFKNQFIKLNSKNWNGIDEINGKIIFIYAEQGLGDVIQFCRFLKQLVNLGAKVIFQSPEVLINLISTLSEKVTIISTKQEIPKHDYNLPLLSLPLKLKIFNVNLFGKESYLKSTKVLKNEAIHQNKINIGIAWNGNRFHKNDIHRSIDLEIVSKFIEKWKDKIIFHSLQKEYRENELNKFKKLEIIDHSSHLNDFEDTASLINKMDLIISVDTSVAHVSASIGKPTWILLAKTADFRWLIDSTDSPWYSSVKLYRQPTAGGWDTVFQAVDSDLYKKFEKNFTL
jgi:tetratricopeptide (TPR) repeat protein